MIGEKKEFNGKKVVEVADTPLVFGCNQCVFHSIKQECVLDQVGEKEHRCGTNHSHYVEVTE